MSSFESGFIEEEQQRTRTAQLTAARQAQAARIQAAALAREQRVAARAAGPPPAPPPRAPPPSLSRSQIIGMETAQNQSAKPSAQTVETLSEEQSRAQEEATQPPQYSGVLEPGSRYRQLREINETTPQTIYEVQIGGTTKTFNTPEEADAYVRQQRTEVASEEAEGRFSQGRESEFGVNTNEVFQDGKNIASTRHRGGEGGSPASLKETKAKSAKNNLLSEIRSDVSTGISDFTGDIETGLKDIAGTATTGIVSGIGNTSSTKVVTNAPPLPQPIGAINPSGAVVRTNPNVTYYIVTVDTQKPSGVKEQLNYYFTDPKQAQAYQNALQQYSAQNIQYTVSQKGTGVLGAIETGVKDAGGFLEKSSEGYSQFAENETNAGNENPNAVEGFGQRFVAGVSDVGAGFTGLLSSTLGKPNENLPQNGPVLIGEGLGIGVEGYLGGEILGGASDILGVGRGATGIAKIAGITGRAGAFGTFNAASAGLQGESPIQVGESFALGAGLSGGAEIGGDLFNRVPGVGSISYKNANPVVKGLAQIKSVPGRAGATISDILESHGVVPKNTFTLVSQGDEDQALINRIAGTTKAVGGRVKAVVSDILVSHGLEDESDNAVLSRIGKLFERGAKPKVGLEGELEEVVEPIQNGVDKPPVRFVKNANYKASIVPVSQAEEKGLLPEFERVGSSEPPRISPRGAVDEYGNPKRNPEGRLTRKKPKFRDENPPLAPGDVGLLTGEYSFEKEQVGDIFDELVPRKSSDLSFKKPPGAKFSDAGYYNEQDLENFENGPVRKARASVKSDQGNETPPPKKTNFSGKKSTPSSTKSGGGYGQRQAFSSSEMKEPIPGYDYQAEYLENPILRNFETEPRSGGRGGARLGGDFGYNYKPIVPLLGGEIPSFVKGRNVRGKGGATLGGAVINTKSSTRQRQRQNAPTSTQVRPEIDIGVDISQIGSTDSLTSQVQNSSQVTQQIVRTDQATQQETTQGQQAGLAQAEEQSPRFDLSEDTVLLTNSGGSRYSSTKTGQKRKRKLRYKELQNPIGASNILEDAVTLGRSKPRRLPRSEKSPKVPKKQFRHKELSNPIDVFAVLGL